MLVTVKGYYEQGRIFLREEVPIMSKTEVIVTFLAERDEKSNSLNQRISGALKGKVSIPDDFNALLEDLKE